MSNCTDCNYLSNALRRQAICSKCRQAGAAVTSTHPTHVQSTYVPSTQVQSTQANGTVELVVNVPKPVPAYVQSTHPTQLMDTVHNIDGALNNLEEALADTGANVVTILNRLENLERYTSEQQAVITNLTIQNTHMYAMLIAIGTHVGVTQEDLEKTMGEMQVEVPAKSPMVCVPTPRVHETLCQSEYHGPSCQSATIKTLDGGRKVCTACIAYHKSIIKGRK